MEDEREQLERKGAEKHPQDLVSERAVGSEKEGRGQRGGEGGGFGRIRRSELGLGRQCNVSLRRRLLSVGSHSRHPAPYSPFMNPPATGSCLPVSAYPSTTSACPSCLWPFPLSPLLLLSPSSSSLKSVSFLYHWVDSSTHFHRAPTCTLPNVPFPSPPAGLREVPGSPAFFLPSLTSQTAGLTQGL